MTSDNSNITWITNFIWDIADDVLRDLYVRGKYRDVILPMTVIRRLDAVLEPTKGAVIKIENIGQLPMPVNMDIKFKDGTIQNLKLPVEIWKRNSEWSFEVPTTKEIVSVQLDPKGSLPDANVSDNTFKMEGAVVEKITLSNYIGSYSSKQIPLKLLLKEENNKLMAQADGQNAFPLEYEGSDKFSFAMAGIELEFAKDKKSFILRQGGQSYTYTKE